MLSFLIYQYLFWLKSGGGGGGAAPPPAPPSLPSLTILVPLRFIIISLVFFYLGKLVFSVFFFNFTGNFARGQNNSIVLIFLVLVAV